MKLSDMVRVCLRPIGAFPLSWLNLSWRNRLLLVILSYVLGYIGLWFFFPQAHNGITMFLPVGCACWLYRYRGLLISMVLNGIIFQLSYVFFWKGILPDQAFVEGGIIGFVTSLGLGLVVCWLRTAVDLVYASRQRVFDAEQARLESLLKERQTRLAYEQQREISALKDQFLLNVSHELRTPLTVLGGYLELLEVHGEDINSAARGQILQEALKGLEDLNNLVDRMLDAARVVSDIPLAKYKYINVFDFLRHEVVAHLDPFHAQDYSIQLNVPEHLMVWADPQFLRQVLNNLFSNIFKYVPPQTEIRIEATQVEPLSPVCLSVQDAGPGIPAGEQPLLFEKFVRLKRDLAGSIRGTGLGLYICKQLVEAMGGQIWVVSPTREGIGSCFYVALPPQAPN